MHLALLTAVSLNGLITQARGRPGHDLTAVVDTPREVWERKWAIRRRHQAVLVGTGTVLVDDPSLASHAVPGFEVVRITLDASGRIPRHARFFDGSVRTLVGVCGRTPREYLDFLRDRGVEAISAGVAGEDGIDFAAFLAGLEERGISSIVCEGGGTLNRSLLTAGLIDRIHLLVIPVVLEARSVNLFEGFGAPVPLRLEGCERDGEWLWLEYRLEDGVR
ncbi:MAG TPA: RibD family protein [Thermoanaerobaculia bacterium]|jgi:riboflavin-specific deaminase-like protein|nr:RibD family protein [Thermoanaerobaculia bacterium]